METISIQVKPCLVQTAQGFTVSYKEKFLYSKYAPQKAIVQHIQNLDIQPQTLFLCVSPVLPYGLKELAQKLPADCLMLGCELDNALSDFEKEHSSDYSDIPAFSFLTKEEMYQLGPILTKPHYVLQSGFKLPQAGTFRRIIRIDFSAGSQLYNDTYESIHANAVNALMTFWANRVTLVKFGRRYCSNLFKALSLIDKTTPLQNYFGKFDKPVYVFGAGESVQQGIEKIRTQKTETKEYYVLCADTALQPLVNSGIIPDGVFIEEAQNIISKCFIGMQNCKTQIFAGLSSLHSITRYFKPEQISYFTTVFIQSNFFERFEEAGILPPKNEPFGSVGLTTFYYANLFRKDSSIPIYTYGLDFAYSAGRTHTKGAMADNARFINSNRIKNDANYAAAFCEPAFKLPPASPAELASAPMYSTPILQRYRQIFEALQPLRQAQGPQDAQPHQGPQQYAHSSGSLSLSKGAQKFLSEERNSLLELKALLTGEKTLPPEQLQQEITKLITEREYLYLHFPDGHKFTWSQSFLNRVRVEVDYFLKVLS